MSGSNRYKVDAIVRSKIDMDEQNKNEEDLINSTSIVHAKKSPIDPDGIVVTGVSVNLEAAKKRMEEDYQKKVEEVKPKLLSYQCMEAIKQMSPKLRGLEQRESSIAQALTHLQKENASLRRAVTNFELNANNYTVLNKELIKVLDTLADRQKSKGFFAWISKLFKNLLTNREMS